MGEDMNIRFEVDFSEHVTPSIHDGILEVQVSVAGIDE